MAKLSPVFNDQTIDENGDLYVGAKLFTYTAGSSTKQPVYTDAAGTIPHSNPIILDSLGFPTQGAIWIHEGISVKFVIAPPTDTDPPTSPIKTIDNVQGVNDASVSVSEWQASGVVPTYISTVSLSLPGDQTTEFQKGRRAQFTTSGGTKYGKIINSVFTTLTTVTMLMDGADVLDSGLSVVNLSLLRATPSALPNPIELLRSAVVGHATLTPTWDYAYGEVQDVSGVVTYTAIPNAPRPGATRIWYPAAGAVMTHGGNISVQGAATITAAAGDKWVITAVTATTFYIDVIKKNGASPAGPSYSTIPAAITATGGSLTNNAVGTPTKINSVTATATSLMTVSTLIDGQSFTLTNIGAGIATFNRVGSDTITGCNLASATSISLNQGESVTLTRDSATSLLVTASNVSFFGPQLIRLYGLSGSGSTNTAIRRITSVIENQGNCITYTDSATLGASLTINFGGVYSFSYSDDFNGVNLVGLSLNSTQLTTVVQSITAADLLSASTTAATNYYATTQWTGYLPAGSVVRPHGGVSAVAGIYAAVLTASRVK